MPYLTPKGKTPPRAIRSVSGSRDYPDITAMREQLTTIETKVKRLEEAPAPADQPIRP